MTSIRTLAARALVASLSALALGGAAAAHAAPTVRVTAAPGTTQEPPAAALAHAAGADPAEVTKPSQEHGGWVAKILHATSARAQPGAGRGWPLQTTFSDGYYAQELLVLAKRTAADGRVWLQVRLPKRPNDSAGWVPADAVRLRHTDWWVSIETTARTVRVYRAGRLALRLDAVVGAPATPTPHGLFAVMFAARQDDPHGFLGPWALHLTALSDVLDNYGGGPGRVALHGRDGASLLDPLGTARSHGCIRVTSGAIEKLIRVLRPGTPVRVTS